MSKFATIEIVDVSLQPFASVPITRTEVEPSLGWKSKISLIDGLTRTIKDVENNF